MSLRKGLAAAAAFEKPKCYQADPPADVLASWSERVLAEAEGDVSVISIFEVIGEDWWSGGGWTADRMARSLKSAGNVDVTVKINSPGGDMFEGIAIYNLLREHPAKVTVEVVGIAASAASVIAMAADEVKMGLGTFIMIHNAWGVVVGNQNDFRGAADLFAQFDSALVDIYEARTGMKRAEIEDMMAKDTFLAPADAVAKGFADTVDMDLKAADADTPSARTILARRRTEAALAKAGHTRSERSSMLGELMNSGAPRDAGRQTAVRDAGFAAAAQQLLASLKS